MKGYNYNNYYSCAGLVSQLSVLYVVKQYCPGIACTVFVVVAVVIVVLLIIYTTVKLVYSDHVPLLRPVRGHVPK